MALAGKEQPKRIGLLPGRARLTAKANKTIENALAVTIPSPPKSCLGAASHYTFSNECQSVHMRNIFASLETLKMILSSDLFPNKFVSFIGQAGVLR